MPSSDDDHEDTEYQAVVENENVLQKHTDESHNDEISNGDGPSNPPINLHNEAEGFSMTEASKPLAADSRDENLDARCLSQIPYQYKAIIIQDNENEQCTDYHFGLIRGYHREMYEEPEKHGSLCKRHGLSGRMAIIKRVFTAQVIGVSFGALLIFFGLAILLIGFALLSDHAKKYFWDTLKVPSQFVHNLSLVGLSLLTLGTALVSLFLLVPFCVKQPRYAAGLSCSAGDLYVKNAEKTENFAPNQFLYFDAAFNGKLFGQSTVKKVQPAIGIGYEK